MLERDVDYRPTAKALIHIIKEEEEEAEPSTSQIQEGIPAVPQKMVDMSNLYVDPKEEGGKEEEKGPMVNEEMTFIPLETLENGAVRRKSGRGSKRRKLQAPSAGLLSFLQYYSTRMLYFLSGLPSAYIYFALQISSPVPSCMSSFFS